MHNQHKDARKEDSILKRRFFLPGQKPLEEKIARASLTEKVILAAATILLLFISLTYLAKINDAFMVEVPRPGGSLTEGIVGTPRFINPLLANSDADRDLTALTYAGLLKPDPSGKLINELASSYEISEDGLTYTFTLKDDIYFHDGQAITAEDVVFTINMAKDPELKSPITNNWVGVEVEEIDSKQVRFTLTEPYSPFLENTTIGILPKHIWKNATPEEFTFSRYNRYPVGAGPYEIKSISENSAGLPTSYRLKAYEDYVLGRPFIETLSIKTFDDELSLIEALKEDQVDMASGISPQYAPQLAEEEGSRIKLANLPRVFGVFFNHNNASIFADNQVRKALDTAAPKEEIVRKVLFGFGETIDGPLPPIPGIDTTINRTDATNKTESSNENSDRISNAREILESAGWEISNGVYEKGEERLSFSISTSDTPELRNTAEILKEAWEEMGAEVDIKYFEIGDLNHNIIRPRKYDALLFGEIIGRDMDLYPFWHSSQRNYPGLNVAMYTNIKADELLSSARETLDRDERIEKYERLTEIVREEVPAVFTYSPKFIYTVPDKLQSIELGSISKPAERFTNINRWHLETERVWRFFEN